MKSENTYWYNVKVTKTLLDKKEDELSDVEKQAIMEYKKRISYSQKEMEMYNDDIRKNCPILCSGYDRTFIPSPGWATPIKDFCYSLEALNLHYGKYGIYVNSSQNKSKYGEYRCYYDINVKPNLINRIVAFPFNAINDFIKNHVDFNITYIQDCPPKTSIEWHEISKENFDSGKTDRINDRIQKKMIWNGLFRVISETKRFKTFDGSERSEIVEHIEIADELNPNLNEKIDLSKINVFKEENGKYFYAYELHYSAKYHMEAKKHRIIKCISSILNKICSEIETFELYESKKKMLFIHEFERKVSDLYSKCVKECSERCEICGNQIETEHSPTCTTKGWISFICEKCAIASGGEYSKDKKKYIEDREIQ